MSTRSKEGATETDGFRSPPHPFNGATHSHLTLGYTGSGKTYSVARRANSWWSGGEDRTLVILSKAGCYNGLIGHCNGVQHTAESLEQASPYERLIKANGVTHVNLGSTALREKQATILDEFIIRFREYAKRESGEVALIIDDIGIDEGCFQDYKDLVEDPEIFIWRVTQMLEQDVPVNGRKEYLRLFDCVEVFGSRRKSGIDVLPNTTDSHREYLYQAGVIERGKNGYSIGLARSDSQSSWYRFREDAEDWEHEILSYRDDPLEFAIEGGPGQ